MRKMFLLLMSATMLLVTSCSKDENLMENSEGLTLAQTEMTYEQILKGYTPEEMAAPKDEMTPTTTPETVASEELSKLLSNSLENTYSKTRASVNNSLIYPYMGVFKVKTCGNYPELRIFMDCEDGGNTNINGGLTDSRLPGSWVDKNKNINLTFCLVMNDQNDFIPNRLGALYLVGGNASLIAEKAKKLVKNTVNGGVQFLERWHDNEDHSNKNSISITDPLNRHYGYGVNDNHLEYVPAPTYAGGEKNTMLTWIFNFDYPIKQFNPGFSYGLLTLKKSEAQIRIGIDDENGSNDNKADLVMWGETGWHRNPSFPGTYYDLGLGKNTEYLVKIIN